MLLPKVPRGLLEIVKARAQGRAPADLSDVVTAIIDATSMYGSDMQTGQTTQLGAGAISRTVTASMSSPFTAPGRMLMCSGAVTMGAAAGTQVRISIAYRHTLGAQQTFNEQRVITAPVAGAFYVVPIVYPSPIVYGPGAQWTLTVEGDAAGADHTMLLHQLFENYAAF